MALIALSGCATQGAGQGPSGACHDQTIDAGTISVKILFAKNGAVQRYVFDSANLNYEQEHQMLLALEKQYGPAQVNAPPLNVVSFKKGGSNGLMIPDKAVDSCGRTLSFQ
jgi:hypothetical protein